MDLIFGLHQFLLFRPIGYVTSVRYVRIGGWYVHPMMRPLLNMIYSEYEQIQFQY